MKTDRVDIRVSPQEKALLKTAALKLQKETGKKPMISKTILHLTEVYLNN